VFGFALHLRQRLASEEQGGVQIARVDRIREVSDPIRRFECTAQQITGKPARVSSSSTKSAKK
jgi:hypothetical protein